MSIFRLMVDFADLDDKEIEVPEDTTAANLSIFVDDECLTLNRPRRPRFSVKHSSSTKMLRLAAVVSSGTSISLSSRSAKSTMSRKILISDLPLVPGPHLSSARRAAVIRRKADHPEALPNSSYSAAPEDCMTPRQIRFRRPRSTVF